MADRQASVMPILLMGILATLATPAFAQTSEDALPPARPIPRPPVIASRIGKPYPLVKPTAILSDAARAAGHHGSVGVSGIVAVDGRFSDVRIAVSSRSALLDEAALVAARTARFLPARDADGAALAVPYTLTLDMSGEQRVALYDKAGYRCAAMVRDADWWHATWPAATDAPDPLFVEAQLVIVSLGGGAGYGNSSRAARLREDFSKRWEKVLAQCRAQPDIAYADAWRDNGLTIPSIPAAPIIYRVPQ